MSSHAITTPARPAGKIRVSLLGPVTVTRDGADVPLSPLELDLLVVLALSPGVAVSTERLVDDLWGGRLPSAPRTRLQGLVSGLRRKVGDAVHTRYPGYLVDPELLDRDLDECERLVAAAAATTDTVERLGLLAAAQQLWRGEPLLGVTTQGVVPDRARLSEQRLSLLLARGEAELEAGRHREVVGLLAPSVEQHPLAEQLAGLYMTALYRSNRQAEALATYQVLRERLADELGADVCAELQELHTAILRGEGSLPVSPPPTGSPAVHEAAPTPASPGEAVPAQLPAPDGLFLGRDAELLDLASSPGHVVVSGLGGLGKTALVVQWGHAVAADYPDGQLFLDLSGSRAPAEVLGSALASLGVTPDQLPPGTVDRIGLYRTLTQGRRLLVVADDADSAEQVLSLVPPGQGSRLVVTTRRRLATLSAHHDVREIVLGPLTAAATRELVRRTAGRDRLKGEDTGSLVAWCAGWPLLARHAAAKLALRPSQSVDELATELALDAGAGVLGDDQPSVDDALDAAYAPLSPDAARLFERLGLLTDDFCLHRAAAMAGTTAHRVRALLDELVGGHLVVEGRAGEFGYHEVVRRYARRLAAVQEWTLDGDGDGVVGCPECELSGGEVPATVEPLRGALAL